MTTEERIFVGIEPPIVRRMSVTTEPQVTAEEALLYLAGLETDCLGCNHGIGGTKWNGEPTFCRQCNGSGKVPVLDLREPCLRKGYHTHPDPFSSPGDYIEVGCPGWVPKQGEEALRQAMHKAMISPSVQPALTAMLARAIS